MQRPWFGPEGIVLTNETKHDRWGAGKSYEDYMGRWSRAIAREFVAWLDAPGDRDWLDVGCGTGALSATILEGCAPRSLLGVDPSDPFIEHARKTNSVANARFVVGGASALPAPDASVDVVTSALAYNFFPDRPAALREMQRVVRPGGLVAVYVWDYPGGGMGFQDAFWAAAVATDPGAAAQNESSRFAFCTGEGLLAEFVASGLADVEVRAIEETARFANFEDFWHPFTLAVGPAPAYCMSLDEGARQALRHTLEARLGNAGPIEFPARAWAARARTR